MFAKFSCLPPRGLEMCFLNMKEILLAVLLHAFICLVLCFKTIYRLGLGIKLKILAKTILACLLSAMTTSHFLNGTVFGVQNFFRMFTSDLFCKVDSSSVEVFIQAAAECDKWDIIKNSL